MLNRSCSRYASDLFVLIARLNVEKVIWIGTSMGGLLGMDIASRSNIISKFVINDIGTLTKLHGSPLKNKKKKKCFTLKTGPKVTREGLLRIKSVLVVSPLVSFVVPL